MPKLLFILTFLLVFSQCIHAQADTLALPGMLNQDSLKLQMAQHKKAIAEEFAKTQLQAMITKTADGRYGYYIFADGQLLIEQKTIPGLPGNTGFITEAEAQKTANFAIDKLKAGEMPPTISAEELKTLQITAAYPEPTTDIKTKN